MGLANVRSENAAESNNKDKTIKLKIFIPMRPTAS